MGTLVDHYTCSTFGGFKDHGVRHKTKNTGGMEYTIEHAINDTPFAVNGMSLKSNY